MHSLQQGARLQREYQGGPAVPTLLLCPTFCFPKGHYRSEQSHLCRCALLENTELEQLGMEKSFQIMRPSTGCNHFYSCIPHIMARRRRLWATNCGNSCLIPCRVGAVGSCIKTVLSDQVVHGQHRYTWPQKCQIFSSVGCLEHSTAAAKDYNQNIVFWPLKRYCQVLHVH